MVDNLAKALNETIQQITHEVVKKELHEVRHQLQDICLNAVENGFKQQVKSKQFRDIVSEEISSFSQGQNEDVVPIIEEAVKKYMSENVTKPISESEINDLSLKKAKELFKQAMFTGSFDLKKLINKAVEHSVKTHNGTPQAGATDITKAVQNQLKDSVRENLNQIVETQIQAFFSSEKMKELLEQKFRAIDLYLKTDLIPKVVKREIAKTQEPA